MYRKRMIVLCLLPAYLLLVLHGVIPHHHHFAAEDGPLTFHHGFNTHHTDHLAVDHHDDPDGHGHTAHFVHSPEFGTAMVRPVVNWLDFPGPESIPGIIGEILWIDYRIIPDSRFERFADGPPPYVSPVTSGLSLRGPPALV